MTSTSTSALTIRIKGISHYQEAASHCRIGDSVTLVPEPTNPYDSNAVRVDCHQRKLGYVPRELASDIHEHVAGGKCSALIYDVLGEDSAGAFIGIEVQLSIPRRRSDGELHTRTKPKQDVTIPVSRKLDGYRHDYL